jgi:p-cumate 2,3-dioxygenase beta subunit
MGGRVAERRRRPAARLRNDNAALRGRIEDFLYLEADLLDDWKVEEWFALFAEGATYEVPPTGSDESRPGDLAVLHRRRLRAPARAGGAAHQEGGAFEFPRSQQRHMISNVRITG